MDHEELLLLQQLLNTVVEPPKIEMRLYYDTEGNVVTYTCENLPGNYIVVTPQQFAEARPDVRVVGGKIVYTHKLSHVRKLVKNPGQGVRTSKYDVNVIVDADENHDHVYWKQELYEITGTNN